jgi:hypothetical protein
MSTETAPSRSTTGPSSFPGFWKVPDELVLTNGRASIATVTRFDGPLFHAYYRLAEIFRAGGVRPRRFEGSVVAVSTGQRQADQHHSTANALNGCDRLAEEQPSPRPGCQYLAEADQRRVTGAQPSDGADASSRCRSGDHCSGIRRLPVRARLTFQMRKDCRINYLARRTLSGLSSVKISSVLTPHSSSVDAQRWRAASDTVCNANPVEIASASAGPRSSAHRIAPQARYPNSFVRTSPASWSSSAGMAALHEFRALIDEL